MNLNVGLLLACVASVFVQFQLPIASFKSKLRDINLYCYLLTLIESRSNRKLLSGNEKYRDVPYEPP